MNIVDYERSHLSSFKPGRWDRKNTSALYCEPGWEGKAASIQEDGRTLGIVGIAVLNEVAHVWAVLSDELRGKPIALCRMAKASLVKIKARPDVEAVQITIDRDFKAGVSWAKWLGFQYKDGAWRL